MPRTPLLITFVVAIAAALSVGAYRLSQDDDPITASLAVSEAMSSDTAGYARAKDVRAFRFPEDHGPHPDYKTEWWYYTGNLNAENGRHFGYELTIFRIALAPPDTFDAPRTSDWAADQLYMAHFGLTDVEAGAHYSFERFSRGAAGLAGAQAEPFRVWLEDWQAEATTSDVQNASAVMPPMRVRAAEDGVAIDLVLTPLKPHVLQGDEGLDPKGPGEGNASYYYSFTRLGTEGTVQADGETYAVEGLSWMDREWSTSALGEDQVGWDWFALQLDDGRELMYYQLRETGGRPSPFSDGVLVSEGGEGRKLSQADVRLEVTDHWTSPRSGARYPNGWRLRVPTESLALTITPYLPDQEMETSVRYWEGAVRVEGTSGGRPVGGSGYVEMTGYGDNAAQPTS